MRRLFAVVQATLFLVVANAQDATLKGKVIDARSGETLIGVNVVYAPGKGTATTVDGSYSFSLPSGKHVITFTSVGLATQSDTVNLAPGEVRELNVKMAMAAAQLDMVVVTAGRFEQRVGEVTQSLSILSPEVVLNKNILNMTEAMDQIPGVVIVDDDPQIRGSSGFSYGAGSRVQVLVDDIPVLSGDIGRPNWNFLPTENLEQIEVIKGASSVLYGSAALSGVINVRTAYPRSTPKTRVTMSTGTYDAPGHKPSKWWGDSPPGVQAMSFFHSRQIGNLDLVLGGNALSDAGYIGPDAVKADSLAVDPYRQGLGGFEHRVRFNTGLRWRNKKVKGLNYGFNTNALKSEATSVFLWANTDEGLYRPSQGTVTRTLGTQYYADPFINYVSSRGTKHSIRGRFFKQIFDNNNGQSNSNNTSMGQYQVQQKADLFGETVITAGLYGQKVNSNSELYKGNAEKNGRSSSTNLAAFLQLDKKIIERISLSVGMRYEQFRVGDDEAAQPVFRAGANYQVMEATYLRISYGQGFRFPTIGERFITTNIGVLEVYPNTELRAEESWNLEGGVKQGFKIGKFTGYFDAVIFQQEFKDYVEFTFGQWVIPAGASNNFGLGFKSVNTGGARVTGYELELAGKGSFGQLEVAVLMGWTSTKPISTTPDEIYATASFAGSQPYSYNTTSFDPSEGILKFRIQDLFRSDIQFEYKRVSAGFSVRYNSHVRNLDKIFVDLDESPLPQFSLPSGVGNWVRTHKTGDTLLDVRAGVKLSEQTRISFIVNNLSNEVYSLRPLAIEAPRTFQVQLMVNI